ncbi:MAG TPA: glycoside hydrolase family 3 N-terminal domain-containing protein, partial [Bryobacteraceae bacterium]|nr:glycoside hydrolase family 3 N-terminal domain-containing protein [Bryobacteraceae bacterium]
VGGMILVNTADHRIVGKATAREAATFINRMQRMAKIPLLVAGDFERGVSMRVDDTTVFPHAMAFTASGDPVEARIEGEITAKESRAIGFQWLFFPDADVNNNPDNPIINIRSYGENPASVSRFVSAFIEGAHASPGAPVLVTAKHFPGHGDTATDTHRDLAIITADRPRLESVEWTPFRAAIASGVDAIMSAHIAVPAIDDSGLPSTLSPKLLTGVLRDELGFQGIVVTDALDMGGIVNGFGAGDASVRALEAGADVLLMPADPKAAIDAVQAAVKSGRLTQARIDRSVLRLLRAKADLGLAKSKLVDLKQIPKRVDTPVSNEAAQLIADRSVTLVRNEGGLIPLQDTAGTMFYTLVESSSSTEGKAFVERLRERDPHAEVVRAHSAMSEADIETLIARGSSARQLVIAAFASVAPRRGSAGLSGFLPKLVEQLVATKKPVVFIAMGNPYLLRNFPNVGAYLATYSTVRPSEIAAAKALFGAIPIAGKLPVSIPGFSNAGEGIFLPATIPAPLAH